METLHTTNSINGLSDRIAYYEEKARMLLRAARTEKYQKTLQPKPFLLTQWEVQEIRRLHKAGMGFGAIANHTNRMRETVQRVITGKTGKAAVKEVAQ